MKHFPTKIIIHNNGKWKTMRQEGVWIAVDAYSGDHYFEIFYTSWSEFYALRILSVEILWKLKRIIGTA